MSGHFEKGAWVEKREDIPDPVWDRDLKDVHITCVNWPEGKSARDIAQEISEKCRTKLNMREGRIQIARDELDKAIDDTLIREYKRLMAIEYNVQRAGFRQRLWYLLTGKL